MALPNALFAVFAVSDAEAVERRFKTISPTRKSGSAELGKSAAWEAAKMGVSGTEREMAEQHFARPFLSVACLECGCQLLRRPDRGDAPLHLRVQFTHDLRNERKSLDPHGATAL